MYPSLNIFGIKMPSYMVMASVGLIISTYFLNFLLLKRRMVRKYIFNIMLALPGIPIGGKLFGMISIGLTNLKTIGQLDLRNSFTQAGIVYYGGLFGYLLIVYLICRMKKQNFKELSNIIALGIPLFHCFGRIGCFLAGCCYGVKSDAWIAVPYCVYGSQELVKRIPVQLIEAVFELCVFIVLFVFYKFREKEIYSGDCQLLRLYLFMYALFRFIIEFWRGDDIRGKFGGISFSQMISIVILIIIFINIQKNRKRG